MKSFSLILTVLCVLLTACKKAATDNTHVTAQISYTPPAATMYDNYSLNGNITVSLVSSQNQIIKSVTLTRAGTADFGPQAAGRYIIVATAEEKDDAYGAILYSDLRDSCTLTIPDNHQCAIELHRNAVAQNCSSGLLCAFVDGISYTAKPFSNSSSIFTGASYNGSYGQLVPSSTSSGGYDLNVSGNNGDYYNDATWEVDVHITQLPVAGQTYTSQAGSVSFDYYSGTPGSQLHYVSDASHTGTVTITSIDTLSNLVSGSFSFTANTPSGHNQTPATHSITSGSFTDLFIRR